ncbi:unnamed protein product [Phaedon cochleariae]|uniref:SET domain-containing protein n=1 Tax=Phaedon cochleariae TaxID=80249 RepID=A0A9N9WY31_PHACE|nr:unnamed protein product [Phaedon cochleariae]
MTDKRTVDHLATVIEQYMIRNHLFVENCPWQIRSSPLGGFGVFAKRNIEAGDLIFRDLPVILGPRCLNVPLECCLQCFSKSDVKICEKKCGLLLCPSCDNEGKHQGECSLILSLKTDLDLVEKSTAMIKCLAPLRSLLLSEEDKEVVKNLKNHWGNQHGHEIDILTDELHFKIPKDDQNFMRFVCSVLDANAFEVIVVNKQAQTSLRGLYPLGSLANHSCFPNAFHVFDDERRMVTRASVFIEKDSEIFDSYSRVIWGTATRSMHLKKTKHFVCKCKRCLDPTEFGTYMSSILCKNCRGNLIPTNPLKSCAWKCEDCNEIVPLKDVARVFSLIGSVLKCFDDGDFELMDSFLKGKLATLVPKFSQVVVEIKYKIIWILGYQEKYSWKDMSTELLELKREYCEDLLKLLKKLNMGQCKMRGLLLYEVFQCLEEILQRKNNNDEKLPIY